MKKLLSVVEAFDGRDLFVTGTCSGGSVYSFEVRDWECEQHGESVVISGKDNSSIELTTFYEDIYAEDFMWIFEYENSQIVISCLDEQNKD